MPIYEYQCFACNKVLEVIQKFSDAPLTACPECGKEVQKLISRASFQLKGSGWYATDYKKSSSSSTTAPAEKPAETSSAATSPAPGCHGGACKK